MKPNNHLSYLHLQICSFLHFKDNTRQVDDSSLRRIKFAGGISLWNLLHHPQLLCKDAPVFNETIYYLLFSYTYINLSSLSIPPPYKPDTGFPYHLLLLYHLLFRPLLSSPVLGHHLLYNFNLNIFT